jgi:hypothetical protein
VIITITNKNSKPQKINKKPAKFLENPQQNLKKNTKTRKAWKNFQKNPHAKNPRKPAKKFKKPFYSNYLFPLRRYYKFDDLT